MDNDITKFFFLGLIICIFIWLGWLGIKFSGEMEAKQFNRFSKTQITWWEALWADYRIFPDK